MANTTFYGDESGSHGEKGYFLSGYIGKDQTWERFENAWEAVLTDQTIGNHALEYFHMRECVMLQDQFALFNRSQADKKLYALVEVLTSFVRKNELTEFTVVLDWNVYRQAVTGPVRDLYHDPYLFLFGAIVAETVKYQKRLHSPDSVYFVFDDQTSRVEIDARRNFNHSKATLPPDFQHLFHDLEFRNDKVSYPLQAADLIAWTRRRRALHLPEDI